VQPQLRLGRRICLFSTAVQRLRCPAIQVCNCVVNGPSVFFTDPSCGLQQSFRTDAQLGEYVWRWDVRSGSVQVAADGFVQVPFYMPLCSCIYIIEKMLWLRL